MRRCPTCNGPLGLSGRWGGFFKQRLFCSKKCRREWYEQKQRKRKWLKWLFDDG